MIFDPKKDFKDVKYPQVFLVDNVLDLPELRCYAQLLADSGSGPRPDIDNLVRYVMAFYDKKSPLVRQISNIGQRKNEAALVAGYDLEADSSKLEDLFNFEDPDLQVLAIAFLKEQYDMYWAMIVSNEQTFWEYQQALNTSIRDYKDDKQKMDALNVKSKLIDECHRITERVEGYYLKVFGDGETQSKARRLKDYSPESMAHRGKNV